jgi:prepilin-type processing-associated H-X9-DG protein
MAAIFISARDGLSNTLLVVEAVNTGIHWMEPHDLSVNDISQAFDVKAGKFISSYHAGGVNVAFGDSHTFFLSDKIDQKVLRALITPNGKEDLSGNSCL